MSKKLLVLAASSQQVETIKSAKQLGYEVVTLDNVPANPGHALADGSYDVDTTDSGAVLAVARREMIDGIMAPCTDVAVPTAAYVAQEMHLAGPPPSCADIVCDKIRFRDFLESRRFPCPEHYPFDLRSNPECFSRGKDWIVKPDKSSGGKGVRIVRSKADFLRFMPESLKFSPTGRGVLEEFIDGFQGTCEGVLKNGRLAMTCILDRQTADAPFVTTTGHRLPTRLAPTLQQRLSQQLHELFGLLDVKEGPFDCDFVATVDEVYLLEMSPRIGGNSIAALLRRALGFNLVEYSIRLALNDEPALPEAYEIRAAAVDIFGVSEAGRLRYDRAEAEALSREPWVDTLSFEVDWDAPVEPFVNSRHRIGYAIVSASDRDGVDARVKELRDRLQIRAADD